MIKRFIIYGFIGWGMEVFWTGLHSLLKKDLKMMGTTSLLMFPIYGMAVFLEPVSIALNTSPIIVRGVVYMLLIFTAEFITGYTIKQLLGVCPWDYSDSPFNIMGLIRLDYAPLWFAVGIIFEKIYVFFIKFLPFLSV